jgi:D-xylose 1-dehydrogenase (NADP+, D-xylono-1,5-lactone-forming)
VTRFGLLSTADINGAILAGARASDRVEVVAVASRDTARAETYAREHGIATAHGSYDALLADPQVDAVYVSLPNSLHVEWSIRALEAGKHVLCEKPMSGDPAQVVAVFDVAERQGLVCMEALMWRHHPQTLRLAALVAEGAIGELRLVRAAFSHPLYDQPNHVRTRPELAGGSLMDLGCYCVSALRLLAGEPTRVAAFRVLGPTGVDERLSATLAFPGAVLGLLDSGFDLVTRSELEVLGSHGSIRAEDPWEGLAPRLTLQRGEHREVIEFEPADHYRLELENLDRAIRGEGAALLGRADAVGQARTIAALVRSAELGQPTAPR